MERSLHGAAAAERMEDAANVARRFAAGAGGAEDDVDRDAAPRRGGYDNFGGLFIPEGGW